jgi:hypothetical protein
MPESGQRHRRLIAGRLKRQREFLVLVHKTGEEWVVISGFEHRHNFYGFVASTPVIPTGYWPHIHYRVAF